MSHPRGAPEDAIREVKTTRTGEVAMTEPGHCYECNTRVSHDPDIKLWFADIDATIQAWLCDTCWNEKMPDDWNDAKSNLES